MLLKATHVAMDFDWHVWVQCIDEEEAVDDQIKRCTSGTKRGSGSNAHSERQSSSSGDEMEGVREHCRISTTDKSSYSPSDGKSE
jgi:hypothetical protein